MLQRKDFDYELIDCGNGQKVERFGEIVVRRPSPQSGGVLAGGDLAVDAVFDPSRGTNKWQMSSDFVDPWVMSVGDVSAEMRLSTNGQVGIFPEQFENWQWVQQKIAENSDRELKILNTFAYTGMASLFASADHTEVCHVDGSKSAIGWARKNAEISGLAERRIRWICDDVVRFLSREVRRGKKYDGIILDPPAFGRGGKYNWKIERDLVYLMDLVAQVLTDEPLFVVLTCHAPDHFSERDLAQMLEQLPPFQGQRAEDLFLNLSATSGQTLPSSFGARIAR